MLRNEGDISSYDDRQNNYPNFMQKTMLDGSEFPNENEEDDIDDLDLISPTRNIKRHSEKNVGVYFEE